MRHPRHLQALLLVGVSVVLACFLSAAFSGPGSSLHASPTTDRATTDRATTDRATLERPMRGMTVSCPMYGAVWASPAMDRALAELAPLGVEWVAIHPYAGVRRDGSVRWRPAAETGYLAGAVHRARDADMELFWKPHLAYWGSFAWRGEIFFDDDRAWRRFFDGYRAWIVDQARFAEEHGIPLLAVGVELEATTHHEAEWRRILAEVRAVYSGRITYAANWDRLDAVPFWDALDYLGVQAYFPLSGEDDPDVEALRRGWQAHFGELERLSAHWGKPVLFAEIGYDLAPSAAREPWKMASEENEATRALRRRLIAVALEEVERRPFIDGMFWWKWIPGQRRVNRDFAMQHPDARELLRRAWTSTSE